MTIEMEIELRNKGAKVYGNFENLPYNPFRKSLYTWKELMKGFSSRKDNSHDLKIYNHFSTTRYNPNINEALAQRIHDHAIDDALRDLLAYDDKGMTKRKAVGIMGGHGIARTNPFFKKTAQLAKMLAETGYFVVSGGGPGIMEAANLGAYFAGRKTADLKDAFEILKVAPKYTDKGYIETAKQVLKKYPKGTENLAIPTWFYGHEPSNLFASHIAKYFSNSIREDTLLAISLYGIVFAPGSAGTTQEIFMDAAQNHYGTMGYYSPMAFLGKKRYTKETKIYELLEELSKGKKYNDLLTLSDSPKEIVKFIQNHPPLKC